MQRPESYFLNAALGQYRGIHNGGFVGVVDYMGNQDSIVEAARVSYGSGERPGDTEEKRVGLIRYLLRNWHTSPFEMVRIKLHLRMPIFVARQWIRHRTASLNEISGRYVELPEDTYVPFLEDVAAQSHDNKQGRAGALLEDDAKEVVEAMAAVTQNAFGSYRDLIDGENGFGVAKELARSILPLGTYTEFVWTLDGHNLMHFLRLRMHPHAQKEIRDYAQAIFDLFEGWLPDVAAAFRDYQLEAHTFSRQEMAVLRSMVKAAYAKNPVGIGVLGPQEGMSKREIDAFKLAIFGEKL